VARRALRVDPRLLIGLGLLTAAGSGLSSILMGQPFMTGLWTENYYNPIGRIGTPMIFDLGVYLVVTGVMLTIIFALAEE
jgi:multicomponent Na+:H+ antiporter subunit B